VLLPVIERYRDQPIPKYFRGDAAFAVPGLFETLEAEAFLYAIRVELPVTTTPGRPAGK